VVRELIRAAVADADLDVEVIAAGVWIPAPHR
jgi:hypothetical protein